MHYLMEIFPIKQKTALPRSFTTVTKLLYINISYSLQSEILHRHIPSAELLYPSDLIERIQPYEGFAKDVFFIYQADAVAAAVDAHRPVVAHHEQLVLRHAAHHMKIFLRLDLAVGQTLSIRLLQELAVPVNVITLYFDGIALDPDNTLYQHLLAAAVVLFKIRPKNDYIPTVRMLRRNIRQFIHNKIVVLIQRRLHRAFLDYSRFHNDSYDCNDRYRDQDVSYKCFHDPIPGSRRTKFLYLPISKKETKSE